MAQAGGNAAGRDIGGAHAEEGGAMEEGIDLRAYVQVLFSHWKLIVGLAVAAAVIALVVTLMLPPIYEADAKILVTESLYRMTFDPRLTTEYRRPAYRALPTLAISDVILSRVIKDYRPSPEAGIDNWTLVTLQEESRGWWI